MLTWLGGTLYRARWSVLLLVVIMTIMMAWYGFGVFDSLSGTDVGVPNSELARAQTLLDSKFSSQSTSNNIILLLSSSSLRATDPQFQQAATQLLQRVKARPEVLSITSYYTTHDSNFLSHNRHQTFAVVTVSDKDGETSTYNSITSVLTSPTLQIAVGGSLAVDVQFNNQLIHDLEFAETVSLPIVALLLVLIFGGFVAALLPLLIGGFAIVGSFAIVRLLTHIVSISSFATNVITIIGLGLAIDYSLFIVTRFREELALDGANIRGALQRAMATAGRTILFSGLTVCTSLISLLLFHVNELRSIGLATIVAALVAMLGALTLLPVLLALLGPRVNALSIQRLLRRKKVVASKQQGAWYHLSYFVMHWRVPIAMVLIAFLLLLGTPFLHAAFATTDERSLPLNASSRIVIEQLEQNFPNQDNATIDIAITTRGNALTAGNLAQLNTYVHHIENLSGVSNVASLVSINPQLTLTNYQQLYAHPALNPQLAAAAKQLANGNVTRVTVTANFDPHANAVQTLVKQIRAISVPAGFTPLVGGDMAQEIDQFASLASTIPYAIVVMACAIFLLLFLMTGSLVMPLKAILLNTLSLTATFGALVWVFQDGHLQNLLQFRAFGALDSTEPILIFAIAFGLSMDYEVFLLSRIKEHFDKTGDNREAVAVGLQRTGWLITSAALLLAVVVAAFATSRIMVIQEIGVGIALAVIMDATLVRALLVPAMMAMLGKWNWWAPRPLQVLWQRIGLREEIPYVDGESNADKEEKPALAR